MKHRIEIEIQYSCNQCGAKDRKFKVRARKPWEDVVLWMGRLTIWIGKHHAQHSPGCRAKEITEVKIPMTGRDYIGGPAKN